MAALAGLELVAHGGLAGGIVESLIVLAVTAVLVAVWLRERKARTKSRDPAQLRDDDEAPA